MSGELTVVKLREITKELEKCEVKPDEDGDILFDLTRGCFVSWGKVNDYEIVN